MSPNEKPLRIVPDGPGLGDDLPCEKCSKVALDTGLECDECGHDNAPTINAATRRAIVRAAAAISNSL